MIGVLNAQNFYQSYQMVFFISVAPFSKAHPAERLIPPCKTQSARAASKRSSVFGTHKLTQKSREKVMHIVHKKQPFGRLARRFPPTPSSCNILISRRTSDAHKDC